MRLLTQTLLASLIIVKIVLGTILIYWVEFDPLFLEKNAIAAQEGKEDIEAKEDKDVKADKEGKEDVEGVIKEDEKGHAKVVDEEEIDLGFLIEKRAELKKEEEHIAKKKAELTAIQEEINKKIAELSKLRKEIRADMALKKRIEDRKLKHLVKAYSTMKPQKAASLIEKLDMDLIIELLSKMKGDVVGGILTFVDVEKAAEISAALVKDEEG